MLDSPTLTLTATPCASTVSHAVAMANADFGPWQDTLYHLHRSMGAVLLPLVLGRLLWRLSHPASSGWLSNSSVCNESTHPVRAAPRTMPNASVVEVKTISSRWALEEKAGRERRVADLCKSRAWRDKSTSQASQKGKHRQ